VIRSSSLDLLDRLTVIYLIVPLWIFILGWSIVGVAVLLSLCLAYSLKSLVTPIRRTSETWSPIKLAVALAIGCAWTLYGGTGHLTFANADWHLRDAVLHDLVAGRWPVGYGPLDGHDSLLRAPIGYYLPAALLGKWAGLLIAHAAMALWTALGVVLFLLLALAPLPPRFGTILGAAAVIVLFSGLDAVGTLLRTPQSSMHWDIARHLEWWAESYQYSSMTTQLFWVPNHAVGGWLTMGLLMRRVPRDGLVQAAGPGGTWDDGLEALLPLLVVALALYSPLTALGAVPFVLLRMTESMWRARSLRLASLRVWVPALAVGLVIAGYLTLDAGRIPRAWAIGRNGFGAAAVALDLTRHAEFFLLEAGLIGAAILAIRFSREVLLALVILALLPLVSFGAANDFVMRVSIPSIAVLGLAASRALIRPPLAGTPPDDGPPDRILPVKRAILALLLLLGAVTPFQEIARAVLFERWPINLEATLIGAACGVYPPHYVARLDGQVFSHLLKAPYALAVGPLGPAACANPAIAIQRSRGLE
jgi:hypothetical protein